MLDPNPNPNPDPSLNPNPKVLDLAAVANPMFKLKGPKMLQGDYAPNFPLQHAHKVSSRVRASLG